MYTCCFFLSFFLKTSKSYGRSYYKCAYTKDKNCEAKKQVQQIQHNPPLYSTTYFGHHTCQLDQAYATFPIDTSDPQDCHMIRFDHPTSSTHQVQDQNQNQNQNHIQIHPKDEYMSPEKAEDWSPSHWMSSEVAHAVEAFGFNPSIRTSTDLSWPHISFPSLSSDIYIQLFFNYISFLVNPIYIPVSSCCYISMNLHTLFWVNGDL